MHAVRLSDTPYPIPGLKLLRPLPERLQDEDNICSRDVEADVFCGTSDEHDLPSFRLHELVQYGGTILLRTSAVRAQAVYWLVHPFEGDFGDVEGKKRFGET